MASGDKKKFHLFDAVLASVCVVLGVEAAAPAAAIGSLQYVWWGILLFAFFVPYGLINAELGTAYEGEGGLYDWVKLAFGRKCGSRTAWYYWINFPIWMCSLAVLFTRTFELATGRVVAPWLAVLVQIAFIWVCVLVSNFRVSESKLLMNAGAVVKALMMIGIGVLGIYLLVSRTGAAADPALTAELARSISPVAGISFVSIILFNFTGVEVVTTFADDMEHPQREIPRAIIISGVLIAVFYLFSSFGISSVIPAGKLSTDSGFMDALMVMLSAPAGSAVVVIAGLFFMFTLAANLIGWGPGVNFVALYAARDGALPKVFASENKHGMPLGANILNGVVATALVVAVGALMHFNPGAVDNIFWPFFALNVIMLLASYLFLFPSFARLRTTDPDRARPFRVPGNKAVLAVMTWVPWVLLVLAMFFCLFYYQQESKTFLNLVLDKTLLVGTAASLAAGELIAWLCTRKRS